jgi:hypothetical protein
MKTAVFNFFVLQIVIWSIVFYDGNNINEVNQAAISDTWQVSETGEQSANSFILHYPTFQKLTLHENGVFERAQGDDQVEVGNWHLTKDQSKLILVHFGQVSEYEIIQFPTKLSQAFVIKEKISEVPTQFEVQYKLTRL